MSPALLPLLSFGQELISRFIPDPEKKAQAELDLLKLAQDGDLKKTLGQLEINAKEAAHPSVFVSGWRPGAGWTCVVGLAYSTVIHNILEWISRIKEWPTPPAVDTETLLYLLGALLGVGTLRTYEKIKGTASK
jgi:hypothetical protein